jgi:hypothetical protein
VPEGLLLWPSNTGQGGGTKRFAPTILWPRI